MKPNNIIYADLSTYTVAKTKAFYESVFNWKYYGDKEYFMAYNGDKPVVGLYETPLKFQQMRMPHFWMTYIQVNNVELTVEKAKQLGGIIEMVDTNNAIGKVALIRDPQGAGFTIYEGDTLKNTRTTNLNSTLIWNELHVSNVTDIIPFYQGIFNWNIAKQDTHGYQIFNNENDLIGDIKEISNDDKGKYEYWVSIFGVQNLSTTRDIILKNGGSIVLNEGNRILCTDNSGQAFFYIQELT